MTGNFQYRDEILWKLSLLAKGDPIPAITYGDNAVGMTLLSALGIEYSSSAKPMYHGIVINARRRTPTGNSNRVNLFAQVPNWIISHIKSSTELLNRYGYNVENSENRLFCTVSSRGPNSQGLLLMVDRNADLLNEVAIENGKICPVVTWNLEKLADRLVSTHPETIWVTATVFKKEGQEYYQYREAVYTGPPKIGMLPDLITAGTITVDHLIGKKNGKVTEKGPLFKINPDNFSLLFPINEKYDLMTYDL
mgnify:CR=1 FL=1